MDKALKSIKKLWYFKERLVLIVLLGFLAFNIYKIFFPGEIDLVTSPPVNNDPPVAKLPEPQRPDAPGQYNSFVRRNPFSYYSDAESGPGTQLTPEELGIHLMAIKEGIGGKYRAQLKTKAAKWYDEGDSFEEFRLEEINPIEQKVVVYANRYARTVVLELEN